MKHLCKRSCRLLLLLLPLPLLAPSAARAAPSAPDPSVTLAARAADPGRDAVQPAAPAPKPVPPRFEPAEAPVAALTFDEALGLARDSATVKGAVAAVEAKVAADGKVSPLTANPTVHLQPAFATSSGTHGFEGEAGLYQPFNLAGLSGARRKALRLEEDLVRAEVRAVALSRKLEAAQSWIELWAAEGAYALAREEFAIAQELTTRTRKAVLAAALTRAEGAEADAYEAEARLAVVSVEGEVTDLGFALASATNRGGDRPLSTAGDLPLAPLTPEGDWPAWVARATALPEARAVALTAEAERARAAEVRAATGLALDLGVLVQRDSTGHTAALASLTFSLPLFERGHREAGTLDAQAARRRGEAEDAARRAATALARAFHEVEHTGEVLAELEKAIVPSTAESVRLRDAAFSAGNATVLEVLLARRAHAAARARELRARAAHAWASAKVSMLVALLREGGGTT